MLPGAAAAEVRAGDQDGGSVESRVIKGMEPARGLLSKLGVGKGKLSKSVEGDALHEAGWNDTVGIDVIAGDEDAASGDLSDFFEGHGNRS